MGAIVRAVAYVLDMFAESIVAYFGPVPVEESMSACSDLVSFADEWRERWSCTYVASCIIVKATLAIFLEA